MPDELGELKKEIALLSKKLYESKILQKYNKKSNISTVKYINIDVVARWYQDKIKLFKKHGYKAPEPYNTFASYCEFLKKVNNYELW